MFSDAMLSPGRRTAKRRAFHTFIAVEHDRSSRIIFTFQLAPLRARSASPFALPASQEGGAHVPSPHLSSATPGPQPEYAHHEGHFRCPKGLRISLGDVLRAVDWLRWAF
jgi:hypothetical protein